mgnify:CR=1 FL=1
MDRRSEDLYGWVVVGAAFTLMFVGFAAGYAGDQMLELDHEDVGFTLTTDDVMLRFLDPDAIDQAARSVSSRLGSTTHITAAPSTAVASTTLSP